MNKTKVQYSIKLTPDMIDYFRLYKINIEYFKDVVIQLSGIVDLSMLNYEQLVDVWYALVEYCKMSKKEGSELFNVDKYVRYSDKHIPYYLFTDRTDSSTVDTLLKFEIEYLVIRLRKFRQLNKKGIIDIRELATKNVNKEQYSINELTSYLDKYTYIKEEKIRFNKNFKRWAKTNSHKFASYEKAEEYYKNNVFKPKNHNYWLI